MVYYYPADSGGNGARRAPLPQVHTASACVCSDFGSAGITGNRDAIDPQAISLKKKKTTKNNMHLSLSLPSLS